jgi:fumarate hydratase class II
MRIERDSMGEMEVPETALYGASTQRAVLNFPISGHTLPKRFVRTLGLVKSICAAVNQELGLLPPAKGTLIQKAAGEIAAGLHDDQFPVDIFQTGSGTSTNMNANEVIANRCSQLAGEPVGSRRPVHPNDDVNLGQSSNDIVPTVLHVSVAQALQEALIPALELLLQELSARAHDWAEVVKVGRTHLMDATPIMLGQEFSGYARQVEKCTGRVRRAIAVLGELAIGGSAVGTGLNVHPSFAGRVCSRLADTTGLPFREATNHFEAQGARDDAVEVAGHLATVAAALAKIAGDIRLLGSGPRSGLQEIRLPATQPGSSIMPGKVNPVMCEMLIQVAHYVQGLTTTVQSAGRDGQLELNVNLPLLAYSLIESVECLAASARQFALACVRGLQADAQRCRELVDRSLMLVTALNPHIGYDLAAEIARQAFAEGKTLAEVVLERRLLDAETVRRVLDPVPMTRPGARVAGSGGR